MRCVLALILVGCVPKGAHELTVVQLEATRVALANRDVEQQGRLREAQARIADLQREVEARQVQLDALDARSEGLEAELAEAARAEAAHIAALASCPLPPEPAPKPPGGRAPPGSAHAPPTPDPCAERWAHAQLTVEAVADAVARARTEHAIEQELEAAHAAVEQAFQPLREAGLAEVLRTDRGMVVRVLVARLFNENRTTLSPSGDQVVEHLAAALAQLPDHTLHLVGHTDDRAVHSFEHASTWELGFAYAVGLLRGLEEQGIPQRPTAGSAAGQRPAVPGSTAEDRRLNRRVELWLAPDPTVLDRFAPTPDDPG